MSSSSKLEFISHKKVLLFGAQSTGKSSFSYWLENKQFSEDIIPSEESK